jgi:serine/threonine-protein kinase
MLDRDFIDLQHALAGEYSLERELGRGGMGIVYLARELQLERLVAIKLLPGALAARADVRERFLREARMAASLSHPHIVPIHRVGEAGGFVFFVMAYVNGETLGERLRARGPLSPAAATRLIREVAWALSYAHGRGIIHRDIKPDNILLEAETGRALVTDFGIARGAEETRISDPGHVMGTAHFMSPEQATNEPLDGRSDFYSLGVVAYLALSGTLPFDGASVPALLMQHVSTPPTPLAARSTATPRALAAVVDRLLRKNRDERYATGEELAEAIDGIATSTRAKLPMALRVWTQAQNPLRGVYMAWSGMFTIGFIAELRKFIQFGEHRTVESLVAIAAFAAAPLVPLTIFHARKAYQALAAGYDLRDLRAALEAWRQEKRDELAFLYDEDESRWAKVLRGATYTFVAGAITLFFTATIHFPNTLLGKIVIASVIVGSVASTTVSSALGVRFMSKRLRSKLIGPLRSAVWSSRAGEWLAKLLTPKNRRVVADLDYRPTEMALSVAVDDLFAALPASYREHVPDLPAVAKRLEAHAAAARARIEEIDSLLAIGRAGATPDELSAARESAKRDIAESVAALQSVRLDLLRLHGGASDLGSITTALDAARELGDELDRLSRAKQEAEDAVSPIDLRPHTPL